MVKTAYKQVARVGQGLRGNRFKAYVTAALSTTGIEKSFKRSKQGGKGVAKP